MVYNRLWGSSMLLRCPGTGSQSGSDAMHGRGRSGFLGGAVCG